MRCIVIFIFLQRRLFDLPHFCRIKRRIIKRAIHLDCSTMQKSYLPTALIALTSLLMVREFGLSQMYIGITWKVTMEDHVLISQDAIIWTHDHDFKNAPDRLEKCPAYTQYVPSDIHIERNVWIGSRAIILPSCNQIG